MWTNRPKDTRLGEWPLSKITPRLKWITVALTLYLPDGHHVRLESPALSRNKGSAIALAKHIRATGK